MRWIYHITHFTNLLIDKYIVLLVVKITIRPKMLPSDKPHDCFSYQEIENVANISIY